MQVDASLASSASCRACSACASASLKAVRLSLATWEGLHGFSLTIRCRDVGIKQTNFFFAEHQAFSAIGS
jgi:hypothetical protein